MKRHKAGTWTMKLRRERRGEYRTNGATGFDAMAMILGGGKAVVAGSNAVAGTVVDKRRMC